MVDTLNPVLQVRLGINLLVMSWFEVMFKVIYPFSSRTSERQVWGSLLMVDNS